MKEIFELSFSPANIFPTILLLFVGLYWVVFLIGFLDLEFLDFDVDVDADMDVDVDMSVGMDKDISLDKDISMDKDISVEAEGDMDLDKGIGGGKGAGIGMKLLSFLNLGDVPFMVFFSFFALFFWAFSVLGNHYLHDGSWAPILGLLVGSMVLGALLTKVLTQPFRKFFRDMGKGDAKIDYRGKQCTLELSVEGDRVGQAHLTIQDKVFVLNVKSESGDRIDRGSNCLITGYDRDHDLYTVQLFEIN